MKKVLVYGDSNTVGYDPRGMFQGYYDFCFADYLQDLVPNYFFFKDGENGRLVRDANYEDALTNIDVFMVMLGSNDILHYYSVDTIVQNMQKFLANKDKNKIVIVCPPILEMDEFKMESIQLNEAYKNMGYSFVDCNPCEMAFDGVHLSSAGHKELAYKLANYFK